MSINLFVYGTLKNKINQKIITNKIFKSKPAILLNYKRYSPRNGFPYIIAKPNSKVYGLLLYDVDEESLKKLDEYEENGILYDRQNVKVKVGKEIIEAQAYIANITNLRRNFGNKVDYKILHSVEKYFELKIGERVNLISEKKINLDDELEHRARQEIYGGQIYYLLNTFYREEYFSEFEIDKELKHFKEPDFQKLNKEITPYIENYLYLIFKVTILNQLENKIRARYIHETFSEFPYFVFTKSILIALKLMNFNSIYIDRIIKNSPEFYNYSKYSYNEIIIRCLKISDLLFNQLNVQIYYLIKELKKLEQEYSGKISLGIELEFSELGNEAVLKTEKEDYLYGNFKYFYELDLLRRFWKLGGHIDDHKFSEQSEKEGGFLELAPGKNTFTFDESVPLSNNPYLVNEIIKEIIKFIKVKPHSIHLIFDAAEIELNKSSNDIDDLKCLLMLGGDWHRMAGHYFENRMRFKEFEDEWGNIVFSAINEHSSYLSEKCEEKIPVIEFQFPRLKLSIDYELLIMALKGYLLSGEHRPIVNRNSFDSNNQCKEEMLELKNWALDAMAIDEKKIDNFLYKIKKGLMNEYHNKAYHKINYIEEILFNIEKYLYITNEYFKISRK
ncbi:MAG TPA: gamma-glutamylcyclotransferase [bacterium]|nr:gamma-glutamylcyclotransferase [bacterium]HOL48333.1 gamma-glutamylcyclotransferase [bacterium]HPQ19848.1 gamma-glutamylcyclotransferase [bacterium]